MRSRKANRIRTAAGPSVPLRCISALPTRILVSYFIFTVLTVSLPTSCVAATAQESALITVRIEPEATITIIPLASEIEPESGRVTSLVKVELVIRINRGATAFLTLDAPMGANQKEQGDASTFTYYVGSSGARMQDISIRNSSQTVFIAHRNGRYELTIGAVLAPSSSAGGLSTENVRLELNSSDRALQLSKIVSFHR